MISDRVHCHFSESTCDMGTPYHSSPTGSVKPIPLGIFLVALGQVTQYFFTLGTFQKRFHQQGGFLDTNMLGSVTRKSRLGALELVTNYGEWGGGGLQNGRGTCEVLPLRKGGPKKVLAMLKGGTTNFG